MSEPTPMPNYLELSAICSDAERHALCVESADWETLITPGLVEFGTILPDVLSRYPICAFKSMRVLFETVYTLGYRRGKRDAQMPAFVVAPEQEADA